MKIYTIISILTLTILLSCSQKNKRPEPNYYRNLFTNEILNKTEFEIFIGTLHQNIPDSLKGKEHLTIHFGFLETTKDSIIQPFNYDIRIGNEYLVRANNFDKIGMKIKPQKFNTIDGDSIQIGGEQLKPMLINLWFINCGGCVAEIPALNKLKEKYSDRVDFVAMTFDDAKKVRKFLNRNDFNFIHIPNSEEFINYIGSKPYPENIFISRNGFIEYIEGGLGGNLNDDNLKYFESIIEKLLLPTRGNSQ